MRIAFVGKGGSGKTTIAALFSRFLTSKKLPILVIDADINQHIPRVLGCRETLPSLGNEVQRIKAYVRGSNTRILSDEQMIKTTPPGTGSRFLSFRDNNPVFRYFAREHDGMLLMVTGFFTDDEWKLGVTGWRTFSDPFMEW